MSALSVNIPFPIFADLDGLPLEAGYIWIGKENLNPQTNPIAVFWDPAMTIPAAQPIRTLAGYPSNNGAPGRLYVGESYSIAVFNKQKALVSLSRGPTERLDGTTITVDDGQSGAAFSTLQEFISDLMSSSGASIPGYSQSGVGAIQRPVQDWMREFIFLKDFKSAASGSDWTTAWLRALDRVPENGAIIIPDDQEVITETEIILPRNGVCITSISGRGKVKAASGTSFEYVIKAENKAGVSIKNIEVDSNKSGRAAVQDVRFMGAAFLSCSDSEIIKVTARNALGYNNIPGVGLAIAGGSIRGLINMCRLLDCGGSSGTDAADGIFTSGFQNIINSCIATNCTDTGFVVETSNFSVISGCTSFQCNASAAITNASADAAYGNVINGLAAFNWSASNTGGVQVGVPTTQTGNLVGSTVSNVTMYAETGLNYGIGAAINVRSLGFGRAVGLTISNARIKGSKNQGILVDGDEVTISGSSISDTTDGCIQFNGGGGHHVTGTRVKGGSFGLVTSNAAQVVATSNIFDSNSTAVAALGTSSIDSLMNCIKSPSVATYTKDTGATLNVVSADGNNLMVNNAVGSGPSGSLVNKFVVVDRTGNPLGYVPVYNG